MSPHMTARAPREARQIATWSGVCPGVGSSQTWSSRAKSLRHQLRLPGCDHRQHAVLQGMTRELRVAPLPRLELLSGEHVARVGEGRHPAAVDQPGVPADVIAVQVGAQDVVDGLRREPEPGERAQVGVVGLLVPERGDWPAPCDCRRRYRSEWCDARCARHSSGSGTAARRSQDRWPSASASSRRAPTRRAWSRERTPAGRTA